LPKIVPEPEWATEGTSAAFAQIFQEFEQVSKLAASPHWVSIC